MFDFVVIGDVIVDRILTINNSDVINSIDTRDHTVSFPFPGKMHLETAPETHAGGNAYNTATTIKKLGLNVALFSVVGSDQAGQQMIEEIKQLGVDCSLVTTDPEKETNSSVILNINSDRLVMSYHHQRNYNLQQMPDTKYVYLTSIGENDLPLFKSVIEHKKQKEFKLIFSPGTLQVNEDFSDVREVMANSDVLILNKEEAIKISRLNTESNEHLLRGLAKFGPKVIIITRSDRGSIAFDGTNITKVGALKVKPVESTGAGDCFAGTVISGLAYGKDVATAMGWGAVNAASAISAIGGTTGLLTKEELEQQYAEKVGNLVYTEATSSEIGIPKVSEHYGDNS